MIDFQALRAANPIADVVGAYIDLRRSGTEYVARCPFHADKNPSFHVVPKKDHSFCNACGWHGDCVKFVAEFESVSITEAARRLGHHELPTERPAPAPLPPDLSDEWQPIPIPDDRRMPAAGALWRVFNPKRGKTWDFTPARVWPYLDATGALLGYVARIEFTPEDKVTPTITYCRHRDTGEERWCSRPFAEPRPLLGLNELAARPGAPVALVSGEKCKDAAARLLPGFVAMTWPGGDHGTRAVDWSPLHGRDVTAWHDLDRQSFPNGDRKPYPEQSGVASMVAILTRLEPHGGRLRMLDLSADFDWLELPNGWDIADAEAAGWDRARVAEFCRERVRPFVSELVASGSAPAGDAQQKPSRPNPNLSAEAAEESEGGNLVDPAGAAHREERAAASAASDSTEQPRDAPAINGSHYLAPPRIAEKPFYEDVVIGALSPDNPTVARRLNVDLGATVDPVDDEMPARYSEDNAALAFAQTYQDDLRYVAAWGRWMRWDGQRWLYDDTLSAYDLARKLCRSVSARAAIDGTMTPKQQESTQRNYGQANTVAAIERLARADRRHAATIEQWDADPWALNTPGGIVNLRTGEIRAPVRGDHMTKITRFAPGGSCPLWRAFLDRATRSDAAMQSFLQRVAGYTLTGSVRDQALFFVYGSGGNGKGTFLNTLTHILNDYAAVAGIDTFTETKNDRHTTELARLRGARLVAAQEVEEGKRWAEAKIKALTGGDPITARFMRMDDFTFIPQFKLIIAGNHKPGLRNVDEAIKRRLHLIPFTVTVPASERDPQLSEKLLAEAPGILAWAIEGCLDWLANGLQPPPAVVAATDEYLEQQDTLGAWIDEACQIGPNVSGKFSTLYGSFRRWAEAAGEYVLPQKRWAAAMESRGYLTEKRPAGLFYPRIAPNPTGTGADFWRDERPD